MLVGAGVLVAACGSSAEQGSAPASAPSSSSATTAAVSAPSGAAAAGPSAQLVNSVCATVRQGAPRPLAPPFTAAKVQRYAVASQPIARRTAVSLRRLGADDPSKPLAQLSARVRDLRAAYALGAVAAHDGPGGKAAGVQIAAREDALSDLARRSGYPACAVG